MRRAVAVYIVVGRVGEEAAGGGRGRLKVVFQAARRGAQPDDAAEAQQWSRRREVFLERRPRALRCDCTASCEDVRNKRAARGCVQERVQGGGQLMGNADWAMDGERRNCQALYCAALSSLARLRGRFPTSAEPFALRSAQTHKDTAATLQTAVRALFAPTVCCLRRLLRFTALALLRCTGASLRVADYRAVEAMGMMGTRCTKRTRNLRSSEPAASTRPLVGSTAASGAW